MTSMLPAEFKFVIQLGGITPDIEDQFGQLKKTVSIPKANMTHFSKLIEAAKSGLKDSLDKLIDILQLKSGDGKGEVEYYFTSPTL